MMIKHTLVIDGATLQTEYIDGTDGHAKYMFTINDGQLNYKKEISMDSADNKSDAEGALEFAQYILAKVNDAYACGFDFGVFPHDVMEWMARRRMALGLGISEKALFKKYAG